MKTYKTLTYRGQHPLMREALDLIDTSYAEASRRTGVSSSTFTNWKSKRSKSSNTRTMDAILRGYGYALKIGKSNS